MMFLVRYELDGAIGHGIVEEGRISEIDGDFFGDRKRTGRAIALENVTLKAPTVPSKIVNMAGNYLSHMGARPPFKEPQPFLATPSSVQDPSVAIVLPQDSTNVHYEGEMAVIIGRHASKVAQSRVDEYVLGVCPANDVSEREWQGGKEKDVQWWRAKSADTFSPFGPWIATDLSYGKLALTTRLNGNVVQSCNTSELIYGVPEIITFVTKYMTLEPGDVIFTGTSGQTGAINAGDVVEVELEGCGVLRNPVVRDNRA